MNNIVKQGTGGVSIKPSARPSIHNHQGCVFAERERMVRYGLNNCSQKNGVDSSNVQGADEVDNIQSKPAHPIRPFSKQKNGCRRNSMDSPTTPVEFDDSDLLSKSVPATLPSRLYCSTSDDEHEAGTQYPYSDISYHSTSTSNRSNASINTSFPSPQRFESVKHIEQERETNPNSYRVCICFIGVIVAVCAVVFSNGLNIGQMTSVKSSTYDKCKFNTDLSSLGDKYNIDDDSILRVQAGISAINEKQDTGSFIFAYNSHANNFNLNEFNEFINDVSLVASKYLRNSSESRRYTSMDGAKLDMAEHSELICRYRAQLADTGVMLVRRLEAVPAGLAMAFHYYCDEYNPLVRNSAIFFTLDVANCPQGPGYKTPHSLIEKCLAEIWKEVPADSIGPLLTRVVNVVVDLSSAF